MNGKLGIGVSSSILNFGVGPTAEYWFSDNLGASASLGLVGDFTTYGIRGIYLFDDRFPLLGIAPQPYVAIGFSSVEESVSGVDLDGTGFELAAGLQAIGLFGNRNLGWGLEFNYTNIELEDDVRVCSDPGCPTVHVEGDFGGFSFGGKLIYYFGGGSRDRGETSGKRTASRESSNADSGRAANRNTELERKSKAAIQGTPDEKAPCSDACTKEVSGAIEQWATAWSARDASAYLAAYAPDFKPESGDRASWENQRRDRLGKASKISLKISELKVSSAGSDKARASFVQDYGSDTFSDQTKKVLELRKKDGRWLITRERVR